MYDVLERFSLDQSVTATAVSQDKLDRVKGGRDIGVGDPTYVVVEVTEDITTATSGSVQVTLETDDTEAMSSPTNILTVGTLTAGSAPKGTILLVPLPPRLAYEQFFQLRYTVTGSVSTGKVSAYLTQDPDLWKAYPRGYTGPTV